MACLTGSGAIFFITILRFNLAAGLDEPWCGDGGVPQGCQLSMVLIVVLYAPWCRHLEVMPGVKRQLCVDYLKCSASWCLFLMLLGFLPGMFVLLIKMCLLVSVFFSAPPIELGRQ